MNRRRAIFKLSLALSLPGVWVVSAPPAAAQDETLTGWFTFTVADYPTESGLASEVTYELTEDSGERHELLLDIELMEPLGGPVVLNRKRVTVVGEWEEVGPDTTEKFRVYSIELAASPSPPLQWEPFAADSFPAQPAPLRLARQAAESDSQVRGSQAWVTILCRFGDATDMTPHPVSYYEKLMGSSYPALAHYWREVSYRNIPDLAGSKTMGWYNLPRPRSYYVYDRDGDGEEDHNHIRLAEDCIAAADADVFFPDFWGINLVFNGDLSVGGFGGPSFRMLDGQSRFWGVTAISGQRGVAIQHIVAHEMGHAFGLQHSSGPYGQDDPLYTVATTYDSRWDVMSGGGSCTVRDPEYGCVDVHTIAYHKDFLGWIPPARKYVALPNTTRTITLERLAQPGSIGHLMAQIPIGGSTTDFYTVETRLFAGYDDEIPDEAVVIHKVDTTRADRLAQVVDIDNNGDPNDEGAMWRPGEVFTDAENNLQVSIERAYPSGYRVTINTNPATFTCIDFLSSSSHLFGPGGDSASVQVEAADDCAWAATSNADWIRVTAGGNNSGPGSVRYTVAANPSPAARTGTLTIGGWTFTVTQAGANEVLFEDDMERGTNGWGGQAPWALTTASAHSGKQAWTDSPGGNYQNDINIALWSPWPPLDLTEIDSATLTFWHRYAFASGDRGNVWVQLENGDSTQTHLKSFTGSQAEWQQAVIDLTPFVGQSIRLIFQLLSDASETADGWYIDDVTVFSSDFDTAPAPDPDYCQDFGPCSVRQGDCDPGQCADGLVCVNDVGAQYGLPAYYDVCEVPSGTPSGDPDPDWCRDYGPCGVGQGDCDPGQCGEGLVCAADVGPQYGLPAIYDVCEVPSGSSPPAPDPDYCRDYGPCGVGQGDCDPGQCGEGLVCAADVGPQYGLPAIYDVCEVPSG